MIASDRLDATFIALADPTRRAILARLSSGDASVMELTEPFAMSQPAISKHLKVLEQAGLISRSRDAQRRPCRIEAAPLMEATGWLERYGLVSRGRDGQRRPCRLEAKPLEAANEWLERYAKFWEANFQRLDALLNDMKTARRKPVRPKR